MASHSSETGLSELLGRLELKQDDEVIRTTLQGRALSRSDDNLHLAVRTGIVAIPIANIDRVLSVPTTRTDIVRVLVRNPQDIKQLFEAQPRTQPIAQQRQGDVSRGVEIGKGYVGVATCTFYDTETVTGDGADQCDDEDSDCQADDLAE